MNLLKSAKQLVISASLIVMSAPIYAYSGGGDGAAGAFDKMVQWLIDVLGGSGGLLLTILALIAAAIGMVTGSMKFMWTMVGVALVCSIGPAVVQALMGVTF